MLTLNPYRIGFRTLKTAVGITLGVILAKWIGLCFKCYPHRSMY